MKKFAALLMTTVFAAASFAASSTATPATATPAATPAPATTTAAAPAAAKPAADTAKKHKAAHKVSKKEGAPAAAASAPAVK